MGITNKLESFEFIDRNYNPNCIQIDMFEKIINPSQIKIGDRFICPPSNEYKSGIVDAATMIPILLFVKSISKYHITFWYHKEYGSNPAVAWDLCYLRREEL